MQSFAACACTHLPACGSMGASLGCLYCHARLQAQQRSCKKWVVGGMCQAYVHVRQVLSCNGMHKTTVAV